MDRNTAIGFTLIALLLMVYFYFFAGTGTPVTPPQATPVVTDTVRQNTASDTDIQTPDAALITQMGELGSYLQGSETLTTLENEDLKLVFSNHGKPVVAELKKYKTYTQQPLVLVGESSSQIALHTTLNNNKIDLHALYYQVSQQPQGDSTIIRFTATWGDNQYIRHVYSIPATGYLVRYRLETNALPAGEVVTFNWKNQVPLVEKDVADTRLKTTINYATRDNYFDGLSESSRDLEEETLTQPIQWFAVRQKFFVAAIQSTSGFSGGYISTYGYPASEQIVKDTEIKAFIPAADLAGGKGNFTYYFGPNEYATLQNTGIASFDNNLYFGWPPIKWVNRFMIVPIFSFLEGFIGNYGLIIIVLVLIIKLILAPLSYQSYLGMAKMRLLKPELDLIKEKYGDNMAQIQQEQMKLYQQAGVNPFSGCIPVLLQMPILFAMFYFFPVSIELRQQSFLWAEDLSTYDSIVNLPFTIPFYGAHVSLFTILMTISTLIYTWQNNQISSVTGPMKQVSMIMPVVFMFLLNSFSAGLSFYYLVSNLVTFSQQAIIKRFVDEDKIKRVMDEHKKKLVASGGTGKKSKFMTKLEEAMKASEEARKKNERK
jgi:YidC/Oxa1 family membrane protein insertase